MEKMFDIYSLEQGEFFKQNRVIFLYGEINSLMAYDVCCKLKYLNYLDHEKEIVLEINSPGGEVNSGLAIIDCIKCIEAPVKVIVSGLAASMAAVILASGSKGLRYAYPHSTVMLHQPLGGVGMSQASDIDIYAKNILKTRRILNEIIAKETGKSIEDISKDLDRDYYMDSKEALEYGIIDKIVEMKKV